MEWTGSEAFLFSVQRAMPCDVSPALTGVVVDRDEKTLHIRCFFDHELNQADREFVDYMRNAVWKDFFPTIRVDVDAVASDLPAQTEGVWVHRKTEPSLAHS